VGATFESIAGFGWNFDGGYDIEGNVDQSKMAEV
jgi:hypothetical protein